MLVRSRSKPFPGPEPRVARPADRRQSRRRHRVDPVAPAGRAPCAHCHTVRDRLPGGRSSTRCRPSRLTRCLGSELLSGSPAQVNSRGGAPPSSKSRIASSAISAATVAHLHGAFPSRVRFRLCRCRRSPPAITSSSAGSSRPVLWSLRIPSMRSSNPLVGASGPIRAACGSRPLSRPGVVRAISNKAAFPSGGNLPPLRSSRALLSCPWSLGLRLSRSAPPRAHC